MGRATTLDRPAVIAATVGLLFAGAATWFLARNAGTAITGVTILTLGILALRYPEVALYGVAGTLLLNRQDFVHAGFAYFGPQDLLTMVFVPTWLVSLVLRRERVLLPPIWPLVVLYFAFCTLSLTVSYGTRSEFGAYLRFGLAILTAFAIVDQVRDRRRMRNVFFVVVVSLFVNAAHGLITFEGGRLMGWLREPNATGRALGTGLFAALAAYQMVKGRFQRIVMVAGIAMTLMCIVLTLSRGTWLAVALTVAVMQWRRPLLLAGLAVVAGTGLVVSDAIAGRTEDLLRRRIEARDRSISQRADTLRNGLMTVAEYPLTGIGFNQFGHLHERLEITAQAKRSAHNFYLEIAAETGLPALLVFLALCALIYSRVRARRLALLKIDRTDAREDALMMEGFQAMMVFNAAAFATGHIQHTVLWSLIGILSAAGLARLADTPDEALDEGSVDATRAAG